jgi:hypothetical protein
MRTAGSANFGEFDPSPKFHSWRIERRSRGGEEPYSSNLVEVEFSEVLNAQFIVNSSAAA